MKKNWMLIITSSIVYLAIITLSIYYAIIPGINKLKEVNTIKELTYEEKTKLIDEINQKYILLEQDVNNKYTPSIKEINDKYSNLEQQIKDKYDQKEQEINNKISDKEVARNNEFFKNGLSKKYYNLSDEISALRNEKWEIDSQERKEIDNNDDLKEAEIKTIKSNQSSELDRLRKNKDNEIYNINNQNINKSYIKTKGILSILIGSIIILIPIIYIILIFNKLTHLSNLVKEKWSQVDIFLKQRTDLIPNIVESVKGFTEHEKSTLTNITKARNQVIKATTKEEEIEANKNLSNAINKLLFLQEDYPELKANTNFMNLQENLKEIENNISYARQIYNKAVLKYKNKLEMFPSNIIADIFNFKPELFFTIDSDDRENPNINFNEK
ncbi:lemA family protein [Clostridium sp. CAG:914]|nr:lemA family protein [Clostridium sp. CAG:914]